MIREEINVLDGYELVKREKKPRQIRTKSTSFSQIKKHFTDFRIRLLNKKLEREKDKAVTEGYKNPASERDSEKMMKRASNIARLEEKIKILDGEKVPIDYVSKRAIKIKKAMMRNISYTSDNIYAVGLENKEEVFNNIETPEVVPMDPEVQEEIAAKVREIMEEDAKEAAKEVAAAEPVETPVQEEVAGYEPDAITKAEIKAEIDSELDKIKHDKAQAVEETKLPHIDLDEIQAVVNDAFKEMQDTPEASATIGSEEIKDVVEESFDNVDVDSKISLEDIKSEVDEAMDRIVSKNANTDAKIDRFNEDGSVREKYTYTPMTDEEIKAAIEIIEYDKYEEIYRQEHEQAKAAREAQAEEEAYVYKPMTDEEIKAAQANIEYDKYEEIYKMQNSINFKTAAFKDIFKPADKDFNVFDNEEEAVREVPVIVPEMDGNRFTSQEVREEVKPEVVSKPTSIEEFAELKAKVVELKKKLAESESKKNTAIKFAERTSDRAEEIKRITIESEKAYQDKLASLQLLAQTLEENCNLNDTAARAAAIDAECNERFICSQMSKKEQYDEAINQVDSILNLAYEESRGRGRAA